METVETLMLQDNNQAHLNLPGFRKLKYLA